MLRLSGITKNYGERRALDGVTFDVAPGRLTGFVGGNGAGKTTTMRIILGLLNSDGGTVSLDRQEITTEDRRRFGYMPEERGLYPKMKVLDHIVYLARLHGFSRADATERATAILDRLGLGERLTDNIEALSLGNQQRAQIAAALVHDPEVLILDEPFSGLDPLAVEVVAGVLQDRAAAGASVLFSSHQLDVVERLCDDLVIIAGGEVRTSGPRERLREEHATNRFELAAAKDVGWVREEPGIQVLDFDGGYALFDADDDAAAQRVLQRAVSYGEVARFAPQQPSLAQIFKEVIR
ncbi:MAG: ABC transporter ATP-binding protein [Microbacteriaceae bacterium]|uniref:ABC transporter ATP-binding protein n=1 Tax=unclassified Microbacterium TaxID=2609290 RepID=UPI00097F193E|nr:ATP-binding cassette domain-containing protein [Microbacterium sp. JB110]RCS60885.1 ATP-binding cassette domain-containing protein [Microbacterium sp. JB110]SJM64246.1 ABC transporter, ATP-binding protein [Frigoribacterium sp. JB110]